MLSQNIGQFRVCLVEGKNGRFLGNLIRQTLLKEIIWYPVFNFNIHIFLCLIFIKTIYFLFLFLNGILINKFISGFQVTEVAFFVSRLGLTVPFFHLLQEFFDFEETDRSLLQLTSFFKSLNFKILRKTSKRKFFAILNCIGPKSIKMSDFYFDQIIKPAFKGDSALFNFISSKLKLKVILKIELWI